MSPKPEPDRRRTRPIRFTTSMVTVPGRKPIVRVASPWP